MSYVPLHVHSEYSIRDSILKLDDYVAKGKELGLESLGLSEHGAMHSAFKFYKACKKVGIKPIIANEFYYAEDIAEKDLNYHLLIIAKNNVGLANLFKMSTISYIDGFYKKPRVDKSILAEHHEGLIVTTACCFGMAAQHVINGRIDDAVAEIEALRSIFGEDFYLEVADHDIPDEVIVKDFFRNYGQENNIKVICATDTHYLNDGDKVIHNIFKQLAYGSVGTDNDDAFMGKDFHVWTPDEVALKFTQDEIDNTLEIASKCDVTITHNEYHLPIFDLPKEHSNPYEYIGELAWAGLKRIGKYDNVEYQERMRYELNILHLADLENYFLIVRDYVVWCKEAGIPVGPGRGSMGSSLVGYCIGITGVDPIEYKLIFARGINAGRLLQYDFGI